MGKIICDFIIVMKFRSFVFVPALAITLWDLPFFSAYIICVSFQNPNIRVMYVTLERKFSIRCSNSETAETSNRIIWRQDFQRRFMNESKGLRSNKNKRIFFFTFSSITLKFCKLVDIINKTKCFVGYLKDFC